MHTSLLATTVCPNCGYSLLGLPAVGVCPECGLSYDQSEIILYGFARGQHENLLTAKGSRLIWVFFLSSFGLLFQIPFLYIDHRSILALAIVFGPAVYLLARRNNIRHPGQVQIRLSDKGCVQYDDLAGTHLLKELVRSHIWVIFPAGTVAIGILFFRHQINVVLFAIGITLSIVATLFSWRACRRFRQNIRDVPHGAIAELNQVYHSRRPWTHIGQFYLVPMGSGNYRLQIELRYSFLRFTLSDQLVDVEISLSEEQVLDLRLRIKQWISASETISSKK